LRPACIIATLGLLLDATSVSAVTLGDRDLPQASVVTYLFAGHSNVLSGEQPDTHPRAWNYEIPGDWDRPEGWVLAQNPLHVAPGGPRQGRLGPGMPFMTALADAHPGYYIGMLQNPNPQATAGWIQPAPPPDIDAADNRYAPGAALGLMEARDVHAAEAFGDKVVTMVIGVRTALGLPELPVLIGIGEWESPANGTHWQTVRDEIRSLPGRLQHLAVVDAELDYGSHYADVFHYNDLGYTRWAEEASRLIDENDWFPIASEPNLGLSADIVRFCIATDQPAQTKTVTVANTGRGVLGSVTTSISYVTGAGWLSVAVAGTAETTELRTNVDTTALSAGAYSATVSVFADGAINSPQEYEVHVAIAHSFEVVGLTVSPTRATARLGRSAGFTALALNECADPERADFSWTVSAGGSMSPASSTEPVSAHTSSFIADGTLGLFDVEVICETLTALAVVETVPVPEIELHAPAGGETFDGGSTQVIEWTASHLDDVIILLSLDDGQSWGALESSVTSSDSRWQSYPWVVPNLTTPAARILLQGYFGEAPIMSESFTINCSESAGDGLRCSERVTTPERQGCNANNATPAAVVSWLLALLLRRRRAARRVAEG